MEDNIQSQIDTLENRNSDIQARQIEIIEQIKNGLVDDFIESFKSKYIEPLLHPQGRYWCFEELDDYDDRLTKRYSVFKIDKVENIDSIVNAVNSMSKDDYKMLILLMNEHNDIYNLNDLLIVYDSLDKIQFCYIDIIRYLHDIIKDNEIKCHGFKIDLDQYNVLVSISNSFVVHLYDLDQNATKLITSNLFNDICQQSLTNIDMFISSIVKKQTPILNDGR